MPDLAFNLICAGSIAISSAGTSPAAPDPAPIAATWHYRLDLRAMRWCEGECETTRTIFSTSDTVIVLEAENLASIQAASLVEISRETGHLSIQSESPLFKTVGGAQCERATFSGFPAVKF